MAPQVFLVHRLYFCGDPVPSWGVPDLVELFENGRACVRGSTLMLDPRWKETSPPTVDPTRRSYGIRKRHHPEQQSRSCTPQDRTGSPHKQRRWTRTTCGAILALLQGKSVRVGRHRRRGILVHAMCSSTAAPNDWVLPGRDCSALVADSA